MTTIEDKVLRCIEKYNLIQPGNNVIVACSGGADSVALFHFLHTQRARLGIRLGVAHFEHGLRGQQSLDDAAYVQSLAQAAGADFYLEHGQMAARPVPKGVGNEEWGRRLRYTFFDGLKERAGPHARVATAHTLSDNAETVLFNAIRGTSTRGLAGIPVVRGGYIRPLLLASRAEVEAYCRQHDLRYIQDSYNFDPAYSRNRLRHQVMPLLEQAHPGAANSLARLAGEMAELDAWLFAEAEGLLEQAANAAGHDAHTLLHAPAPLRRAALKQLAGRAAGTAALERLEQVLAGTLGGVQLPGGQVARLYRGSLVLSAPPAALEYAADAAWEKPLGEGEFTFPAGQKLRVKLLKVTGGTSERDEFGKKDEKGLLFLADYDKISRCSVFRQRRAGDRFAPRGRGLSKTLKKWMSEAGLPRPQRAAMPLLCEGSRVLWVWGTGFCEGLAPDEETTRLLVLRCTSPEDMIKEEELKGGGEMD